MLSKLTSPYYAKEDQGSRSDCDPGGSWVNMTRDGAFSENQIVRDGFSSLAVGQIGSLTFLWILTLPSWTV
jgi:hypothetical protein